jgi:hypothetical protein
MNGRFDKKGYLWRFIVISWLLVSHQCPMEGFLKEAILYEAFIWMVGLGGFEPPTY